MWPAVLLLAVPCQEARVKVPPGVTVTQIAGSDVASDIHCLALKPDGGILVSGRGYVRELSDEGKLVREFRGAPRDGAMGLFWEGDDLYCVGDGGLKVWRKASSDHGLPPTDLFKCRTGGEHTAHAVRRGPDGWMYLLVGDGTGITAKEVNGPRSPVKDPVAGCILRFSPDWKVTECYAHGFRNAYGMDFGPDGELYTFDSDNERCVSLPWYEGTRFYRVRPGGHHGWLGPKLAATWRMPPYFYDCVPPLVDLGRGSPTGVAIYKHAQLPAKYRGGAFLCDWTFGVLHFVPLSGGKPEVFLKSTGDEGLAPVAIDVHPRTGDLYFAIGGRGTRGAVYRIRHTEGLKALDPAEARKLQPRPMKPRYPSASPTDRKLQPLDEVRQLQLALGSPPSAKVRGTAWEGYVRSGRSLIPARGLDQVRKAFPTGEEPLDTEMARTLALAEDDTPEALKAVASKLTEKSHPTADFHYLLCLARLRAKWPPEVTSAVTRALLTLEPRLDEMKAHRESNWPARLAELHAELAARGPGLNEALASSPLFGHPGHVVFTREKSFPREKAAEAFLARKDLAWSPGLVRLLAEAAPKKALPRLREAWGQAGLDDEMTLALARHAIEEDHPRLLASLQSARVEVVRAALTGLEALKPRPKEEAEALIIALRQLPQEKALAGLRAALFARLEKALGKRAESLEDATRLAVDQHPGLKARLASSDGVDEEAWRKRLAGIPWDRGSAERGRQAYVKASCAACHSGTAALGPDLAGVTKRFSRHDLLTAILRPSKDVAERYRMTRVTTEEGQVYQGIVAYEAADSLLLLTGPARSVRIVNKQIQSKSPTALSLMPTGLLDRLTDQEVADLYAYLRVKD
jgi:putative heme-binding domain-containing protein